MGPVPVHHLCLSSGADGAGVKYGSSQTHIAVHLRKTENNPVINDNNNF